MTRRSVLAAIAGLTIVAATSAFAQGTPPAPAPAPPPGAANRLMGSVTAVDPTTNSVTVTDRQGTATTITVPSTAKIFVGTPSSVSALTTGQYIQVRGTVTQSPASVDARQITILASAPTGGKGGLTQRGASGAITATSPLAISAPDGTSIAVTTTDDTRVISQAAGAFSDIAVGNYLQARLSDPKTAEEVTVGPPPMHRGGHRQGGGGGGGAAAG